MIGPYAIEQDYSHYVINSSRINFAVVGLASKGPIGEPVLCTSNTDLLRKFGPVGENYLALYAARYYLNAGSNLYFVRASHRTSSGSGSSTVYTVAATAATATVKTATKTVVFTAVYPGTYYNNLKIQLVSTNAENVYKVVILEGEVTIEANLIDLSKDPAVFKSSLVVATSITSGENTADTTAIAMTGGTDGDTGIVASDYIYYGNLLANGNVDMNLFAVPGISNPDVITAMMALAEDRGDCLYLVDPPSTCDTPDKVRTWHNGAGEGNTTRLVSDYAALYWSWQYILTDVGTQLLVPPSVVMGYTFARSARQSEIWFSVAGVQRGLVQGVYKPQYAPDYREVEGLYEGDEAVNCIVDDPTYGLCLWGQKTLSRSNTATNRVNVRMLINYLKRIIVTACKYLTFEPNDYVTWNAFEDLVEPTLKDIGNRRGLYAYKIVKGEAIVTEDDIDNYRMPCKIMIKPTKAAEIIPIYFTITSTGADFNTILESEGIIEN